MKLLLPYATLFDDDTDMNVGLKIVEAVAGKGNEIIKDSYYQ